MASAFAARMFARGASKAPQYAFRAPLTRTGARITVPARAFRQQGRRGYASESSPSSGGGSSSLFWILGLAAVGGGGYYAYSSGLLDSAIGAKPKSFTPTFEDYQKVYDAVAHKLIEENEYDDGSYGPVILRLAWHASGTYEKETGTGGSNGATMRFSPEGDHGANSGLQIARDFLEPIKEQFPWISYGDLWTLAGVCAIQEMQGPIVPWRPGRQDKDVSFCTPDGRLPDASKTHDHIRDIFYRMGLNDQEIVALIGAHALGRCHTDRSGYDGPWTFSPITLTNDFYQLLIDEKWGWRKWNGPAQYEDKKTRTLMMLPSDMALVKDKNFRKYVEVYAKDNDKFFKDFSDAIVKLFELGVPFTTEEDARFRFKPSE